MGGHGSRSANKWIIGFGAMALALLVPVTPEVWAQPLQATSSSSTEVTTPKILTENPASAAPTSSISAHAPGTASHPRARNTANLHTLPTVPSPPHSPAISRPIDTTDLETFADTLIPALMQRDHVLGVSVAIVQGHTPLLVKGYGFDHLNPARPVSANRTLFRLGSITKTFTWVVARQEVEAGRLSMDKPISTYLPPDIYKEDRRFQPIRLRDLMDHSAGFEDAALGHLFYLDINQVESIDSYLSRHRPKRVRDPGLYSSYSNYGAALAAMATKSAAHYKDVPGMMEGRLFKPLGLDHTTLREPYDKGALIGSDLPDPMSEALAKDLSDGYEWTGSEYTAQPFDHAIALSGALGGSSTATDMARYMSALLNDGTFDGVSIYGPVSAPGFRTPLMHVPEGYNGWAQGFMIRRTPQGFMTYGHSGSTLWFSGSMILVPELNLGIYIAANTQTGSTLTSSFPDMLLGHLKNDESQPPAQPAADQDFASLKGMYEAFKGHYVSTRRAYGGLESAITRLLNTVKIDIATDGHLTLSSTDTVAAYVPSRAQGFFVPQIHDTSQGAGLLTDGLHFLSDSNNRINRFETSSNMARYERVSWAMTPEFLGQYSILVVIVSILTLIGLGRSPERRNMPTDAQRLATWVNFGIAAAWILAIATFESWRNAMADEPTALFIQWPNGQVALASILAFFAGLASFFQIASLYTVLVQNDHFDDGWSQIQKTSHIVVCIIWFGYGFLLTAWGALEFWSPWFPRG